MRRTAGGNGDNASCVLKERILTVPTEEHMKTCMLRLFFGGANDDGGEPYRFYLTKYLYVHEIIIHFALGGGFKPPTSSLTERRSIAELSENYQTIRPNWWRLVLHVFFHVACVSLHRSHLHGYFLWE